jgi:hypothetical protein
MLRETRRNWKLKERKISMSFGKASKLNFLQEESRVLVLAVAYLKLTSKMVSFVIKGIYI